MTPGDAARYCWDRRGRTRYLRRVPPRKAPALLAALTEIADTPCDHGPGFCPRAVAKAAVAKAAEAERRAAHVEDVCHNL